MTHPHEKALRAIIDRSLNGELGTSKVIDMRQIAERALAGENPKPDLEKLEEKIKELDDKIWSQRFRTAYEEGASDGYDDALDLIKKCREGKL